MSYDLIGWVNDESALSAENFNHMDEGIKKANDLADKNASDIAEFANEQIPEEYVKSAVDTYIEENEAGIALKEEVEALDAKIDAEVSSLSSEIVEIDKRFKLGNNKADEKNAILGTTTIFIPVYIKPNTQYVFYQKDRNNLAVTVNLMDIDRTTVLLEIDNDYAWVSSSSAITTPSTIVEGSQYWVRVVFASADALIKSGYGLFEGNIIPSKFEDFKLIIDNSFYSDFATNTKSEFYGKKHLSFGDSITEQATWQNYFKEYLGTSEEIIKGYSGQAMWANCTTEKLQEKLGGVTFDFATVMFGTNDWGQSRQIGTISDTNAEGDYTGTFMGSLNTFIDNFTTLYPTIPLIMVTPPYGAESVDYNGQAFTENGEKNLQGLTIRDYAKAIIEVCEKWNIPCFDFNNVCGWNKNNKTVYLQADANETFVHPNAEGGKVYARRLANYCKLM